MTRLIDAEHLRSRLSEEINNGDVFAFMIDTEPTACEDAKVEPIEWIPTKRERRTRDCHSITNGVECSKCRTFEEYPSRFCKGCGGIFQGELPQFVEKMNKRFRRV